MTDHVCACYSCAPDRFPRFAERQGDGHLAAYLGDRGGSIDIFLDGKQLLLCFEAFAGTSGRAIVGSEPIHGCDTCWSRVNAPSGDEQVHNHPSGGLRCTVVKGNIEVRRGVKS